VKAPTIVQDLTVDGAAVAGKGAPIDVLNPATEEVVAQVPAATEGQVDEAVAAARAAFDTGPWPRMTPAERSAAMHRFADAFDARAEELVATIVAEVGTPVSLARPLQVQTPATHLRHFAELAERDRTEMLGPHDDGVASASLIAYRPAGVVSAIAAYNYPLTLAAHKVGAALAAGCTVVLTPSPRTPLATLALGEIGREAELPPGVLNVIAGGPEVGIRATNRPDVDRVSFTGSVAVGSAVMRQASANLTNVILELGGKSANIVLPGYELTEESVAPMHLRYLRNAGQGCASPTRILVHEDDYEEFLEVTRRVYAGVGIGDPWDPATVVGPLIRPEHRDSVEGYVTRAVEAGGRIVAGGGRPDEPRGWYVNPTLVGDVDPSAEICQEEIFGPVGVILRYRDLDEAVAIANGTRFGLAAYIHSPDLDDALAIAPRLQAGSVYVNGGGGLRPDAPLGGFKASGIGREIGEFGVREYLEPQHVQWAL
jgi:aldehyde dehydrogenase (NAD+)/betaine-aldehyde dehydrogenase